MNIFNIWAKLTLDDKDYKAHIKSASKLTKEEAKQIKASLKEMIDSNNQKMAELKVNFKQGKLSVGEFNDGIKKLKNSNEETEEAMRNMGIQTDKTSSSAVKAWMKIAGAVVAVIAAVAKLAVDTLNYGARIEDLSNKLGMSKTAVQEWDFVAKQNGTTVEGLSAAMKTLANAAENGDSGLRKLIGSVRNSNGELKSQEVLLRETLTALSQIEDKTERAAVANKVLGRSAQDLGGIMNMSAGEIDAMMKKAHDLGIVLSDEVVNASDKMQDSIEETISIFKSLLSEAFVGDPEKVDKMVDNIIERLSASGPKVVKFILTLIRAILMGIARNLPVFFQTIGEIVRVLFDFIFESIINLNWLKLAWDIISGIFKGIGGFFSGLFGFNSKKEPELDFGASQTNFGGIYSSETKINQTMDITIKAEGDTPVSKETAVSVGDAIMGMLNSVQVSGG